MIRYITPVKIRRWIPLVICLGLLSLMAGVFMTGEEGMPIAEGDKVLLPPEGNLLAVSKDGRRWSVYDSLGKLRGDFESDHLPLWLRSESGRSLVFAKDGTLKKMVIDRPGACPVLFQGERAVPHQALRGGWFLIAHQGVEGISGFSICSPDDKEKPIHHRFEEEVVFMTATLDGLRIACAVPDGAFYRIDVLKRSPPSVKFHKECGIEDANYPELFWSWDGNLLLFSSCDGGVELYDFSSAQRRWITESSFASCGLVPFKAYFGRGNQTVFLELLDVHGYRQVTTFDTATGKELRFSTGWLDHFSLVLSRNGCFLTFRQGELPALESGEEGLKRTESIYLYDFRRDEGYLVARRAMKGDSQYAGPAFSGDLKHLYFEKEGWIYQYALPE